jgi:hypothetical protein
MLGVNIRISIHIYDTYGVICIAWPPIRWYSTFLIPSGVDSMASYQEVRPMLPWLEEYGLWYTPIFHPIGYHAVGSVCVERVGRTGTRSMTRIRGGIRTCIYILASDPLV